MGRGGCVECRHWGHRNWLCLDIIFFFIGAWVNLDLGFWRVAGFPG